MEKVPGMHRVAIGRLLNSDLGRKPRTRQRGRTYGIDLQRALTAIVESFDYLCAGAGQDAGGNDIFSEPLG